MSIRYHSTFVLVIIGLQMLAAGQDQSSQETNANPEAARSVPAPALSGLAAMGADSEVQTDEDLQIPSLLGGLGKSSALTKKLERSNYLSGGINVSAGYDDNALLTTSGQVGNTTFSVFPDIAIAQSKPRILYSLAYGAGLTVNQRLSNTDQASHHLTFDSLFRLSPHVSLRAAENFSLIAGIFGASSGSNSQPGFGAPNTSLVIPLANQRSSETLAETSYHFASKALVGASASFYDLHFSDVTTGPGSLVDTRVAAGSAFWLHELFHGNWTGITYRFRRITYSPSGETRVHTFAVADTLNLSKAFHLSAFFGPEYSDNSGLAATGPDSGQVTKFSDWAFAGGLEGDWQSVRTSVTVGYFKEISDGSGIFGAVSLQNAHAAIHRKLSPSWTAGLSASYGSNQALTLTSATTTTSIKTMSLGGSLERNIRKSLGLQIAYFHDFQDQSGAATPSQNYNADRNRFLVTLSYHWAKPLGR